MSNVGEYAYGLHEAHKARMSRLWFAPQQKTEVKQEWPEPEVETEAFYEEEETPFIPLKHQDLIIMISEKRRSLGQYHYTALDICRDVAKNYRMTLGELLSHRRERRLVKARQHAIYIISRVTMMSLPQIGHAVGGRDHTTVMHSIKKFKQRLLTEDV